MILVWLAVLALIFLWADVWRRSRPAPPAPPPLPPRQQIAGVGCDDRDARAFRVPQFPATAELERWAKAAFLANPFDMPFYVTGATP